MEKFCRECGCEILSEDDVGYESQEYESYRVMAFAPVSDILEKPFIICKSCKEEEEQVWESFMLTDEFKYECEFNRWIKTL